MPQFVNDTFTDTDGVFLEDHTGETGATWTNRGTADRGVILTNRLRCNNSAYYSASGTPAGAEYDVEVDYYCLTVTTAAQEIRGRYVGSVNTAYGVRYLSTDNDWQLRKTINGTSTILGTYDQTLSAATNYALKLEIRDATKKLFVDGVERISSEDNDITDAGLVGFYGPYQGTTVGFHTSRIWATDAAAAGGETQEADFSIGAVMGITLSAQALAGAAVSLANALGISVSAQAATEAQAALTLALALAQSGAAQAEGAISLPHSQTISSQGVAQADATLTIAAFLALAIAAEETGGEYADFSIGISAGISAGADAQASAALAIAYQLALQISGVSEAAASLALGITAGVTTSAQISVEGAVGLAYALGLSSTGAAIAGGSLTVNQVMAITTLAQALAQAGISISAVQSLTMTATQVIANLVTPDGRTFTVSAEVRSVSVAAESRTVTVEAENRTVTIH